MARNERPNRAVDLVTYAWPIAISSLGSVAVGFIDTVVIGRYSTPALSGVAMGAAIYELPINALLGALMAYRILAPRSGDRSAAGLRIVLRPVLLAAAASVLLMVGLSGLGLSLTADPQWVSTYGYLIGRSPSLLVETLSTGLLIALVAWGRTRLPLYAFLLASVVNLGLDLALVYGLGPFPELGALGDGIASTVGGVAALGLIAHLFIKARVKSPVDEDELQVFSTWARVAKPSVLTAAVDYVGNLAFTGILAFAGASTLAGARVGAQVHVLAFVLISSVSSAALYVYGRGFSESDFLRGTQMREIRVRVISLAAVIGVVIALVARPLSLLVSPDTEVQRASTITALVVALCCPLAGWAYANVTTLRLCGRTDSDFVSNSAAVWAAQIPVALGGLLLLDGLGAFVGLLAYWVARGAYAKVQVSRLVRAVAMN